MAPRELTYDAATDVYVGEHRRIPSDAFNDAVAGLVAQGLDAAEARKLLLNEAAWDVPTHEEAVAQPSAAAPVIPTDATAESGTTPRATRRLGCWRGCLLVVGLPLVLILAAVVIRGGIYGYLHQRTFDQATSRVQRTLNTLVAEHASYARVASALAVVDIATLHPCPPPSQPYGQVGCPTPAEAARGERGFTGESSKAYAGWVFSPCYVEVNLRFDGADTLVAGKASQGCASL